jgi:hypothetical protein
MSRTNDYARRLLADFLAARLQARGTSNEAAPKTCEEASRMASTQPEEEHRDPRAADRDP